MGLYCKLVNAAIDKGEGDNAWEVMDTMFSRLEKLEPDLYDSTVSKLEKLAYKITEEEAERIVRNMRPKGQKWSYNQVVSFVQERGIQNDLVNWYLVMNMVYNDFYNTARHFELQDDPEFYFSLAKDFIEDPDAHPLKVEKYFSM